MSPFSKHISYARLADHAESKLSLMDQKGVQAHLAECRHCAGQVAFLEKMMRLMRDGQTPGASAEAVQWVMTLIRTRTNPNTGESRVRKILAVLRSELPPLTPVFGERSEGSAVRQLLYQADENAIDLQIMTRKEGLALAGQVLGPCVAGDVELTGESGSIRAPLNESGEFNLETITAGDYKLWVRWLGVEIEVSNLTLQH